ncbi:MAG: sugar phosphate nucleotidyltransferase [Conexivisphaerales archaeon]
MKAVITAAGLGTRLLSVTKELPKEMLPLFCREGDSVVVKPLVQLIFEQLHEVGVRDFCFIIGRGKRAIEDHFTPDSGFLEMLGRMGKLTSVGSFSGFYDKLRNSNIVWVNQPEPRGFGDAVLRARNFVGEDREFLVAAGDTYIITDENSHLTDLIKLHRELGGVATLLLRRVKSPSQYGVAEIRGNAVISLVEKPAKPSSNLAIMPFYVFDRAIFEYLEKTKPGVGSEIQLTDAISEMIRSGLKVNALLLGDSEKEKWLDIGTPSSYWEALKESYGWASP